MGASTATNNQTSGFGTAAKATAPVAKAPVPAPVSTPAAKTPTPVPAPVAKTPAPVPTPVTKPVASSTNIPGAPGNIAGVNTAASQVAELPRGMYYFDPTPPTKGPAGYKAPGTYNPNQFYNLDPKFQFPSPNLPATTPGLSKTPSAPTVAKAPAPAPTVAAKTPTPATAPVAKTPAPTPTPIPTPEPRYSGFYIAATYNAKVAAEKAAAEKAAAEKAAAPTPVAKTPAPAPTPVQDTKQYLAALNARTGVSNQQKVAEFENYLRQQKLTGKLSKEYLAAEGRGYSENDPRRFDNPYQTAMNEMGGYNVRGAGKDGGWALMGRNSTKVPYQSYVNWEGMSAADKARFANMDEPLTPTLEERAKGITIRDKALKQGYYDIDKDFWTALGQKATEYNAAQHDAWRYGKPFSGDVLTSNQGTQSPFG